MSTPQPERLSASVAARHLSCHASANLPLAIPGWEEPVRDPNIGGAAGAGTSVHKVIEDLLKIEYVTKSRTSKFNARDMIAMGKALVYIGEVWSKRRFRYLSEHTVHAEWLVTRPQTTADLVFYTEDQLEIVDTKWGLIPVEVVGNEQLLYYARAYAYLAPKAKWVTVHIVQPRADNIESWTISAAELKQFEADTIAAEAAIQSGDTTFGPSDHCKFCPAFPHSRGLKGTPLCPATLQLLYPRVEIDEAEMLD